MTLQEANDIVRTMDVLWRGMIRGDDALLVWIESLVGLNYKASCLVLREMRKREDPAPRGPGDFARRVRRETMQLAAIDRIERMPLPPPPPDPAVLREIGRKGYELARKVLMDKGVKPDPTRARDSDFGSPLTEVERLHKIHIKQELNVTGCRFCEHAVSA